MAITYGTASGDIYWDIRGKSTDEKPTKGVPPNSSFYEIDTKKVYIFDVDTMIWLEQ